MTDASGTWSDERVALLKKLWEEGRSASQIAAEIGGVSRNAVIGKVHRLGLSGRVKSGAPAAAKSRAKAAPAQRPQAAAQPSAEAPAAASPQAPRKLAPSAEAAIDKAFEKGFEKRLDETAAARAVEQAPRREPALGETERVTIMDLREGMCRWPVGDPTSPEFRFCGARSLTGMPYCQHHAQIAYQPSADRRRDRKVAAG